MGRRRWWAGGGVGVSLVLGGVGLVLVRGPAASVSPPVSSVRGVPVSSALLPNMAGMTSSAAVVSVGSPALPVVSATPGVSTPTTVGAPAITPILSSQGNPLPNLASDGTAGAGISGFATQGAASLSAGAIIPAASGNSIVVLPQVSNGFVGAAGLSGAQGGFSGFQGSFGQVQTAIGNQFDGGSGGGQLIGQLGGQQSGSSKGFGFNGGYGI